MTKLERRPVVILYAATDQLALDTCESSIQCDLRLSPKNLAELYNQLQYSDRRWNSHDFHNLTQWKCGTRVSYVTKIECPFGIAQFACKRTLRLSFVHISDSWIFFEFSLNTLRFSVRWISILFLLLLEFFNSINIRFVQMTLTEAKLDHSILYEILNFINQIHN